MHKCRQDSGGLSVLNVNKHWKPQPSESSMWKVDLIGEGAERINDFQMGSTYVLMCICFDFKGSFTQHRCILACRLLSVIGQWGCSAMHVKVYNIIYFSFFLFLTLPTVWQAVVKWRRSVLPQSSDIFCRTPHFVVSYHIITWCDDMSILLHLPAVLQFEQDT